MRARVLLDVARHWFSLWSGGNTAHEKAVSHSVEGLVLKQLGVKAGWVPDVIPGAVLVVPGDDNRSIARLGLQQQLDSLQ